MVIVAGDNALADGLVAPARLGFHRTPVKLRQQGFRRGSRIAVLGNVHWHLIAELGHIDVDLRDHRAALVRYLGALQRGWTENARDPARAADLAVHTNGAALGLDEKQQIAENQAQIPLTRSAATAEHGLLWIDRRRMSGPIYAGLRATGRTKLPEVDRLIDMSLLRDVAAARRHGG